MPVNPGIEYQLAEEEFHSASTTEEKLKALQKMWSTVPKHKSSEGLQQQIKQKIAKYKEASKKEKASRRSGRSLSLKKEGSATISILGVPNSGKSTLLKKLTNANVLIADYQFSTTKPEVGILNYKGVLLQIIEIPAIIENFEKSEKGPTYLAIMRMSDLLILMGDNLELVKKELEDNDIYVKHLVARKDEDAEKLKERIWKSLDLMKIYTKQPRKKHDYPPLALEKGASVRDLANNVHKDFVRNFKFARVWGKSAKFEGQRVGIDHKLKDEDIVEFHTS